MGVWKNRLHVDIDWQDVLVRHHVMFGARRNINIAASDAQHCGMLCRRIVSEMNADPEFNDFGLAGRLHVGVQHQAGVGK